ncbi:MAG: hypothetical protein NC200_06310, partial [Candidatus Gastranaerophilales bacterium]|nr:hypothetical protein [Candidatus Gastranaerophilales bacterium]
LKYLIKKGYRYNCYFAGLVVNSHENTQKLFRGDNVSISLANFERIHSINDSIDITKSDITDDNIRNIIMQSVSQQSIESSSKTEIFNIPNHEDLLLKIGKYVLDNIADLPEKLKVVSIDKFNDIENPNFGIPLYYVELNKTGNKADNVFNEITHNNRDEKIIIVRKVSGECVDSIYLDAFEEFSGYSLQSVRYDQYQMFLEIIEKYGKEAGKKVLALCKEGVIDVEKGAFSEKSEPYRFKDVESFYRSYKNYIEKFLEYMEMISGLPQKMYDNAVRNILSRKDFIFDFIHPAKTFIDLEKMEFNFLDFLYDESLVESYKNNNQINQFKNMLLGKNLSIDFNPAQVILYSEDIEVYERCAKHITDKINNASKAAGVEI